jgi:hypothetical protein
MTRDELAHILRAEAQISQDPAILVIGSQAVLGTYHESALPREAWLSAEADLAWWSDTDPDDARTVPRSDQVDGAIGELSMFHSTHGYYAQGVDVTTAKLPDGWMGRLVRFPSTSAQPAEAVCLEVHDLAISKLVAMRQKDLGFTMALLQWRLLDPDVLAARAEALTCVPPLTRRRVLEWIARARTRIQE